MKSKLLLIPILSASLIGTLFAQQSPQPGGGPGQKGRSGPPSPEQMLEHFDANEDGVIDLEEIEVAFAEKQDRMQKRQEERNAQGSADANSKGQKRDGSKMAVVIVEKFDADGDGLLSAEELQKFLVKSHQKRMGGQNGPRGPQE